LHDPCTHRPALVKFAWVTGSGMVEIFICRILLALFHLVFGCPTGWSPRQTRYVRGQLTGKGSLCDQRMPQSQSMMSIAEMTQRGGERHKSVPQIKSSIDRITTVLGTPAAACAERQIKEANSREPAGDRTPLWCRRATYSGTDFHKVGRLLINDNHERPHSIPGIISLYLATRGNSRRAGLHQCTRGTIEKPTI
jgi:hypothetical protein